MDAEPSQAKPSRHAWHSDLDLRVKEKREHSAHENSLSWKYSFAAHSMHAVWAPDAGVKRGLSLSLSHTLHSTRPASSEYSPLLHSRMTPSPLHAWPTLHGTQSGPSTCLPGAHGSQASLWAFGTFPCRVQLRHSVHPSL